MFRYILLIVLLWITPSLSFAAYANYVSGQYYGVGSVVRYTDGNLYIAEFANPGYDPTISTYFWNPYVPTVTSVSSSTCSYPNYVGGRQYTAGSIVRYTDGNLYIAEFANPGYDPTISTYFWDPHSCTTSTPAPTPAPTPSPTCSFTNYVSGKPYAAGEIVRYTNGNFYRAKYSNPGYDPLISTYFWARVSCSSASSPSPTPVPTTPTTPTAPIVAGQVIPLPSRVVATYSALWTGLRITSIPSGYNQIYLFHATPNSNGSGAFVFGYSNAVSVAEIQTVRARGQRVVLTVGGANAGFNFQTRTQSQNFVNSIISIITNQLGGQIDGLDFNNFEAGIAPSATEMSYISLQLKARYGNSFSISSPPAPWSQQDLQLSVAMVQAGALDYAGPQFYDDASLISPDYIVSQVDRWVAALGSPTRVVVGFGSNYAGGSSMAQVQTAYARIKAKYPNIRGVFGWSADNDRNAGWTFGNYFLNNK